VILAGQLRPVATSEVILPRPRPLRSVRSLDAGHDWREGDLDSPVQANTRWRSPIEPLDCKVRQELTFTPWGALTFERACREILG
jgi:hypothetical protein